ncbi:LOW QUALITY PROTEIN: p450 domain-containing protein, partial [Cephalotus follicularis]
LAFAIFVRGLLWMLRGFHKSKSKKRAPPEARGQWPVIGHLHHLGGPQLGHIVLGSMADKYGPIYTIKHVREYEVKASLKELYQYWVNKKDTSNKALVEMKRWFKTLAMNVILTLLVGKVSGGLIETEAKFLKLTGMFVVADALPILRRIDIGGHEREMVQTAKELDHVAQVWLEKHKQRRVSGAVREEDFMDIMLSILDEADEFPNHDADTINISTGLTLMLGASDTTSAILTWGLSLLLNNRHALKKVQEEIDTHIGKERQVKESDIKNLIYLQAIIKETIRLYPGAPLSLPHESMEDCTVSGYHVPAGTRLLVNLWKIQRDPRVWTDPCEFQPERFLTTYKNIDVRGQNFELIPFGAGRRMCPGISFALQVLQLTLASLLHGFEITTLSDEPVDMAERVGLTSLKATPLKVLLTPRLPTDLYG